MKGSFDVALMRTATGSPAGEQFNTATLLQRLLLEALQRFPSPHAASARRYMVCRMLYESLQEQQKGQKGEQSAEAATALLVAHRQLHDRQQSSLGASSSGAVHWHVVFASWHGSWSCSL